MEPVLVKLLPASEALSNPNDVCRCRQVDWEEFVASAAAHQTMLSEAKLRAAFDFIDADHDGRISKGVWQPESGPRFAHGTAYTVMHLHCTEASCWCNMFSCLARSAFNFNGWINIALSAAEDLQHMLTELQVDHSELDALMDLAGEATGSSLHAPCLA